MIITNHLNNFNALRLILALIVVFGHSYDLSGYEVLKINGNQIPFGSIGVSGFFVISGYLIYKSGLCSKNIVDFFKKRCLRIFPALIVCLVITVLVLWAVYPGSTIAYLEDLSVWSYVPRNASLIFMQYGIGNVFLNNPYPSAINGSLWTLAFEFIMYMSVGCIIVFNWIKEPQFRIFRKIIVCSVVVLLSYYWVILGKASYQEFTYLLPSAKLVELGLAFWLGCLIAEFRVEQLLKNSLILYASLVSLICIVSFGYYPRFGPIVVGVVVMCIGLRYWKLLSIPTDKLGDISYGVYIYSFPIQQILVYELSLDPLKLFIVSGLLTILCGYLSWIFIESRFLRLKDIDILRTLNLRNT